MKSLTDKIIEKLIVRKDEQHNPIVRREFEAAIEEIKELEQGAEFNKEKVLSIADAMAMLPSSQTIEANAIEGGLRDGELQMFWEGAEWLKCYLQKRLLSQGN